MDHYEGVPRLYIREKCAVKFNDNIMDAEIYVPTKETWESFERRFVSALGPFVFTEMNKSDLWLIHLKENHPEICHQYPELFK